MALFVSVCVVRTFTAEGAGFSFNTGVQDASHNMPGATAYTPTRTFIGSPFVTERSGVGTGGSLHESQCPLPDQSEGGFGSIATVRVSGEQCSPAESLTVAHRSWAAVPSGLSVFSKPT